MVPNIPVGPNRNGPFHFISNRIFPGFWAVWKAPQVTYVPFPKLDPNVSQQYQMSIHLNMDQLFQVYQMPNLPTILKLMSQLSQMSRLSQVSHARSKVQVTFHRSRVQVTPPSINYQTTQIPLDLTEHFVKILGLGDTLNRASDISRKEKQNFEGFSGPNSPKNRPISRDFRGKKVKTRGTIGRFQAIFTGEKSKFAGKSAHFAGF